MKKDNMVEELPKIKKIFIWNKDGEKSEPVLTITDKELAMINISGNEPFSSLFSEGVQKLEFFIERLDLLLFPDKLSKEQLNVLDKDFGIFRLELELENSLNEVHQLAPEVLNFEWKSCTQVKRMDMFLLIHIDTSSIENNIKKGN